MLFGDIIWLFYDDTQRVERSFRHPWETVVQATWRKYPNPMNPSVRGIDVLNRTVDENGVLKSHRLLTTTFNIPSWVSRYLPNGNSMFGSEHSQVDPQNKVMNLRTKNLTLSSLLSIEEQLCYQQHPEDGNKTLLTQEAVVTVQGIPLSSYLEGVVTDRIDSNAGKRYGRKHRQKKIHVSEYSKVLRIETQSKLQLMCPSRSKLTPYLGDLGSSATGDKAWVGLLCTPFLAAARGEAKMSNLQQANTLLESLGMVLQPPMKIRSYRDLVMAYTATMTSTAAAITPQDKQGRQAMEWVIGKLKAEALDLKVEAQKCMDNVLPNLELKVDAQKCMDNVLPTQNSSAL